ncbi:MAG: hypothetical protein ABJM06_00540 [Gilvibacter sp.]
MVNKKDIGEVFNDSLQDFEQAPPNADKIWDAITTELDLPQDNDKAAPVWLRGAGLGLLTIGLIVTLFYYGPTWFGSESTNPQEQITDGPTNKTNDNDPSGLEGAVLNGDTDSEDTAQPLISEGTFDNTKAIGSEGNQSEVTDALSTNNTQLDDRDNSAIAASESTTTDTNTTTQSDKTTATSNSLQNSIIANDLSTASSQTNRSNNSVTAVAIQNNNSSANTIVTGNNSTVNNSTTARPQIDIENNTVAGTNTKNRPARGYYVLNKSSIKKQGLANTVFTVAPAPSQGDLAEPLPVIALTYDNIVKAKKSKAMRALEREIRTREALDYKWTVGAVVAPTTYGSVTKGSMLDARLIDNPRKGETNLSYGIKVKNQFTPKSALRFGVNKINLGYNTQNFQVNVIDGIVNIYQLTGIDPGQEISEGISLNAQATEFFAANDVVGIDQQISYIEFPLEYEYAVINRRFGANLIGGSSLIVLSDNRIFATSEQGQNLDVGSASNLTGLGYTLNLGLGLDYEISKNIQFNVDPIFKLQLNGPNNAATNNFRPYYFGIYSGLSFKF